MKLNKILSIVLIIACLVSMFATNASACWITDLGEECSGWHVVKNGKGEIVFEGTCEELEAWEAEKEIQNKKVTNDEYYKGRKRGLTKTDKYYVNERGWLGRYIAPLEVTEEQKLQYRTTQYFDDVPLTAWYAEAVNALAAGGILTGDGKGHFRPNDTITYAELCIILARLDISCDLNDPFEPYHWTNEKTGEKGGFDEPVNWAHTAFQQLYICRNGVAKLGGFISKENQEAPYTLTTTKVTREMALMRLRAYGNYIVECMNAPATEKYLYADQYAAPGCEGYTRTVRLDENGTMHGVLYDDQGNIRDDIECIIITDLAKYDLEHPYNGDYSGIVNMYRWGYTVGIDADHNVGLGREITRAELCALLYRMGLTYENCCGKDASGIMWGVK